MRAIDQCDVFFLSYDEPLRDLFWSELSAQLPRARRVHGVKGFDAAYKRCGELASTDRFFTVDGDNRVNQTFLDLELDFSRFAPGVVLSWSSLNPVNGLRYGNGGIKNWSRSQVRAMRTHEASQDPAASVDFCFQLPYHQMPETLSTTEINATPYQAFRAGFREGIKLSLERGRRPDLASAPSAAEAFARHVAPSNLSRLRIWCSVGADLPLGDWVIFGARLGCSMCLSDWRYEPIRDYDWLREFWAEQTDGMRSVSGTGDYCELTGRHLDRTRLLRRQRELGELLNRELRMGLVTMSADDSAFFKTVYLNPPREGPMYPAEPRA